MLDFSLLRMTRGGLRDEGSYGSKTAEPNGSMVSAVAGNGPSLSSSFRCRRRYIINAITAITISMRPPITPPTIAPVGVVVFCAELAVAVLPGVTDVDKLDTTLDAELLGDVEELSVPL